MLPETRRSPWLLIAGIGLCASSLAAASCQSQRPADKANTADKNNIVVTAQPLVLAQRAWWPAGVSADFDGDGIADRTLWGARDGRWRIEQSATRTPFYVQWGDGSLGDTPVPADYDGDGKADVAVWRASTGQWYQILSATQDRIGPTHGDSRLGDVPVPGDYDGDKRADLAVWRTSNNTWYIQGSAGQARQDVWGSWVDGDVPVPRDYNGDGVTDLAVFNSRTGNWLAKLSGGGTFARRLGTGAVDERPVPGDYDGDRKVDIAIWSGTTWSILPSSGAAEWQTTFGDAKFGDEPIMGADFTGDGKADAAVWRGRTGQWLVDDKTFPLPSVSITPGGRITRGDVAIMGLTSGAPAAPAIKGFADLHFHMMAEDAFGGGWLHGRHDGPGALDDCDGGLPPSDHARIRQNLSALTDHCPASIATQVVTGGLPFIVAGAAGGVLGSEMMGKTQGTEGDTGLHLKRSNQGSGWPRWDTIAHQQGWFGWLRSAHQRGLQVAVMSAVSFDWLCSIIPESNRRACDEMADVTLQLAAARAFAKRHASWVEIALSPAHARRIIGEGKLAMVLSVEASHIMGRDVNESNFVQRLDALYAEGVRTLQPVHQVDNAFGGAALHNGIFQFAQYTENCHVDLDCGVTTKAFTLGFDVDSQCKNVRGLTPLGRRLVTEMMNRGMMVDISHLSEKGIQDAFNVAAGNDHYPIYISHGHFREVMTETLAKTEKTTPAWIIEKLRQSGGIFGLRTAHEATNTYINSGVANNCHGSSKSFAQAYQFGDRGLKVPMAFGADLNGFIQQTRPRFGDDACSATFKAEADCQAAQQRTDGPGRTGSDLDEKGLAHEGLLPDLVADLKNLGVDTSNIERSAENFVSMWERAEGRRLGRPLDVSDMNTTGIEKLADESTREAAYPSTCGTTYCPAQQEIGNSCRYDVECKSNQCTAIQCEGVGLPGRCVCNDDNDCAASQYCALKVPGIPGDNACEPRLGDHSLCDRDRACASGSCGGFVSNTGWCFTPSSKNVSDGCRVNAECVTGSCGDISRVCNCTEHSQCGKDNFCGYGLNSGKCQGRRVRYTPCANDFECKSDKCAWLRCTKE